MCICVSARFCCYCNGIATAAEMEKYDKQVKGRRSQTERKHTDRVGVCVYVLCVCVCTCLCKRVCKSLNSYLLCMCQMALCTLLLHNQNSESHFHAHTCSHRQAHMQNNMHTDKKHWCQKFMNQIPQGQTKKLQTKNKFTATDKPKSTLIQHRHAYIKHLPTFVSSVCVTVCVQENI